MTTLDPVEVHARIVTLAPELRQWVEDWIAHWGYQLADLAAGNVPADYVDLIAGKVYEAAPDVTPDQMPDVDPAAAAAIGDMGGRIVAEEPLPTPTDEDRAEVQRLRDGAPSPDARMADWKDWVDRDTMSWPDRATRLAHAMKTESARPKPRKSLTDWLVRQFDHLSDDKADSPAVSADDGEGNNSEPAAPTPSPAPPDIDVPGGCGIVVFGRHVYVVPVDKLRPLVANLEGTPDE